VTDSALEISIEKVIFNGRLGNLFLECVAVRGFTFMVIKTESFYPRENESSVPTLAMKQRLWLEPKMHKIVFRIDATTHAQFGKKMEGVEWSYKKINCLSSQTIFDDKGLCYGFNLREGAVHTSLGPTWYHCL